MNTGFIILGFIAGMVFGIDIGWCFSHEREVQKRLQAEAQMKSSIEHEAYLRANLDKLYYDNEYLRNKNERRKLSAADTYNA